MIRNSRRMVALAVAGAVAIAPVISGCGAGFDAQSAAPTRLTEGVNVSVPMDDTAPQVQLRNMFVLGPSPKPGEGISPGMSLPLYGAVINQVRDREDKLVSVSSPQFDSASIQGGGLTLPPAAQDGTGSLVLLHGGETLMPAPESPAQSPAQPTQPETGTATPEPTGPGSTAEPTSSPTSENTPGPTASAPPPTEGGGPVVILNGLKDADLVPGGPITLRMQFEKAGSVEFTVPLILRQDEYSTYPLVTPANPGPGSPGANGGRQSPGTEPAESAEPGASPSPSGQESPAAAAGH